MLRTVSAVAMTLLIFVTTTYAQDLTNAPICRGSLVQKHSPVAGALQRLASMVEIDGRCKDTEFRIGYPGFDHCRMHPDYQTVFPSVGCNCYTGQCRPTRWRVTEKHSADNPEGIEIYISGGWYAIPTGVLHKFYGDDGPRAVPPNMLEYDAHVCASDPSPGNPPHIECAWIKDPS